MDQDVRRRMGWRPPGECSCGVPGCPELGWPHEWWPDMDDCVLCMGGDPLDAPTAVRYGSGYAHPECVAMETA